MILPSHPNPRPASLGGVFFCVELCTKMNAMLAGDDVKRIRERIGEFRGRPVSQYDLGMALGLAPRIADRAVRDWEELGPSGPGSVALQLIDTVLNGGDLEAAVTALFHPQLPFED